MSIVMMNATSFPSISVTVVANLTAIVLLISFVVAKEIMTTVPDRRSLAVGRIINVGLLPLLAICGAIILSKLVPVVLGQ